MAKFEEDRFVKEAQTLWLKTKLNFSDWTDIELRDQQLIVMAYAAWGIEIHNKALEEAREAASEHRCMGYSENCDCGSHIQKAIKELKVPERSTGQV